MHTRRVGAYVEVFGTGDCELSGMRRMFCSRNDCRQGYPIGRTNTVLGMDLPIGFGPENGACRAGSR